MNFTANALSFWIVWIGFWWRSNKEFIKSLCSLPSSPSQCFLGAMFSYIVTGFHYLPSCIPFPFDWNLILREILNYYCLIFGTWTHLAFLREVKSFSVLFDLCSLALSLSRILAFSLSHPTHNEITNHVNWNLSIFTAMLLYVCCWYTHFIIDLIMYEENTNQANPHLIKRNNTPRNAIPKNPRCWTYDKINRIEWMLSGLFEKGGKTTLYQ